MSPETADPPSVVAAWWERHRESAASYLSSLAVHAVLLLLMALIVFPLPAPDLSKFFTIDTEVERPGDVRFDLQNHFEIAPIGADVSAKVIAESLPTPAPLAPEPPALAKIDKLQKDLQSSAAAADILGALPNLGDLGGRSAKGRAALTKAFGGNADSEAAVAAGLEWLKRHQNQDGSWSFDHLHEECGEDCTDPGAARSATVASTAMALLCFVGAGHTHEEGAYQPAVQRGLEYLRQVASRAPEPGDLRQSDSGAGMYSQGLVTICLCELHALTRDRKVGDAAQACVRFIIAAQHPKNGGWRYHPKEEQGDTSVVGWQLMALTSARMARLRVSSKSRDLADKFLDSVQMEGGAYYGYTSPQKRPSTTAIGLLCRMYQGWKRDNPALQKGVAYLSKLGPARDDMYYNYYATQVLHHWGGEEWKRWNEKMRDQLIATQSHQGHATGSWTPRDPHGREGGRLYMTCLAVMTLEVYYRHLPLYQQRSFEPGE